MNIRSKTYCCLLGLSVAGAATLSHAQTFIGVNQSRYLVEFANLNDPSTPPVISDPTGVTSTSSVGFAGVSVATHYDNTIGLSPNQVTAQLQDNIFTTELSGGSSFLAQGETHILASSGVAGQSAASGAKSFFFYMFQVSAPAIYQFSGYVSAHTASGAPTLDNQARLYINGGPTLYQTSSTTQTISQTGIFTPGINYVLFADTDFSAITHGLDTQEGSGNYFVALSLLSVPEPTETVAALGAVLVSFALVRKA
ncbi:MAG TPA: hypothetical protein VMF06_17695, partial [Candidatus Limnocylindria bacterium]|nr:hypothetical protein [Candidatus Limnocylindria bacterium]